MVAVETRFGDVELACGAREGVKRAVAQSILCPEGPRDDQSSVRRSLKRTFGRFRVRVTFWNTFRAMRWACVGVVPQRVEGCTSVSGESRFARYSVVGGFLLGLNTGSLPSFADTYSSCRNDCLVPTRAWISAPSPGTG